MSVDIHYNQNPYAFLTGAEVAARLRVSKSALRGWRARGEGPPCRRVGGIYRYGRDEFEAWLDGTPTEGTPVVKADVQASK